MSRKPPAGRVGKDTTRPRTLEYGETLKAVEQRIIDALPEIVNTLVDRAKAGDLKAAAYLADRILGRSAGARIAPADDREPPYSEAAFRLDQQERDDDADIRRLIARSGARRGA
jgi:hypothetical protein